MITYKLIKGLNGDINMVKRTASDSTRFLIIPFAEDNIDYQEYLEWEAEGNTPEPADE